MELEGPDDYITLARAAQLSSVSASTLRVQAAAKYNGSERAPKLRTVKLGHDLLTTRRWLHDYLTGADDRNKGRRKQLPAHYLPPVS